MSASAPSTVPIRWRAPQRDGIGHAYPKGERAKAACGAVNQSEQFDWPRRSKCAACVAATETPS